MNLFAINILAMLRTLLGGVGVVARSLVGQGAMLTQPLVKVWRSSAVLVRQCAFNHF